jgi:hypothetical protein
MDLQENIIRILKEETEGIDSFINQIDSRYKMSDELKEFITDFIKESDCKKIEFTGFKFQALGLALHDGVLINKLALNRGLDFLLFVIFHEIAHQYQFKKYGDTKMYECYIGDISVDDAAKFMKTTEEVADEYASRKFKELVKKKIINSDFVPPQMYKNVPISQIRMMVDNYRKEMKSKDITSSEKISEYFYNMVKSEL